MKLTYKYKTVTKYVTNMLIGALCAYSVCACGGGAQNISPVNTNPDNDQADTQYDPDPTDTDSGKPGNQDKPDEQNNPNDQDTSVEQPDQDHQETPNDQDTPVEQPDQDHQETPNDQDTPIEQPDQDVPETPDEQPDQDVPVDPGDVCHGEGCQGNRGCKPGYVWMTNASYYVDTGGDPDYHCVACTDLGESIVDQIRRSNKYCPGGDDLKGQVGYYYQLEKCPEYTYPNASLDDCECEFGVPPLPKEECYPAVIRKKPLIINPKVNVVRRNNSTTQLLLRHKMRERKTNKR